MQNENVRTQSARRRTFAIISHPDAGKTTLTEKMLLYGGALELAGAVTAKKKQRETASDWMELEKQRGISISSTLLQFDYDQHRMNLLDTPGHKDFSEDTYRVLMAVDAAIMVIDAGKGIESQTRKLFEICRKRGLPIFTFINKMDRPSLAPLELIDQLEKVLNLHAFPVNWPLGNGTNFKGIYDRLQQEVHLFERVPGGAYRAPVQVRDLSDPLVREVMYEEDYQEVVEELEMLDGAHEGFDLEAVHHGKTSPVFFGSAANNFGVEFLLKSFLRFSPGPAPRKASETVIPLDHPHFTSFVFKVQTNMNPRHRDRVVFARVCSGRFERDLKLLHPRTERPVRLSDSFNIFGRDRDLVEEAYPGDILGFVTKLDFRVGDTISSDPSVRFSEIPRFAPELFAFLRNKSTAAEKSFRKGLSHLLAEDIVQSFSVKDSLRTTPLLGAMGALQFDVLQYRLRDEYQTETELEMMPWTALRWLDPTLDSDKVSGLYLPGGAVLAEDNLQRWVVLFSSDWSLQYFLEKNPSVQMQDTPFR